MITNKKQWKANLSSKEFKRARMSATRKLARTLAVMVHFDGMDRLTPEQKRKHLGTFAKIIDMWRQILDVETVNAVHCDKCLDAIVPGGPSNIAKQVVKAIGITLH